MNFIYLEYPENHNLLSLSCSKIKTFTSCKAKFRFTYIEKLPRKDYDFHIFGKFLHEVLENFHKKLMLDASLWIALLELMEEQFIAASENWKGKITESQKEEAWIILQKYLLKITKEHEEGIFPTILHLEKAFYININDVILLNGFIDRVQLDPDGMLHVADYKSSKDKKYLKNDFFQLLTYAFVMCLEDPFLEKIRTSYIMLRHDFDSLIKEYSRNEVMNTVEKELLDYAEKIKSEKLYLPQPSPLCKFCQFSEPTEEKPARCVRGYDYLNPSPIKFGAIDW